jgi:hypothetical protein
MRQGRARLASEDRLLIRLDCGYWLACEQVFMWKSPHVIKFEMLFFGVWIRGGNWSHGKYAAHAPRQTHYEKHLRPFLSIQRFFGEK